MLRLYHTSDIYMLTACDVIASHALENLDALTAYNPEWNREYFSGIKKAVADVLQSVFGIRSGNTLKDITAQLTAIQGDTIDHLTMIHRQISTAWRTDPVRLRYLLTTLGFTTHWKGAKNYRSLADLLTLLEIFAKACSGGIRNELKSHRISDLSIEFVLGNVQRLYNLNVMQESIKDSRKQITVEAIEQFNAIYSDTMFYATTAQILFKANPARVKEFTFSHIVRGMSGERSGKSSSTSNNTPEQPE